MTETKKKSGTRAAKKAPAKSATKKTPTKKATAKSAASNKETKIMATNTQKTAEATVEGAKEMFGDINGRAKAAMEKSGEMAREMGELGKGNMEAFVASARIAAEGTGELAREAADFSRTRFEAMSSSFKDVASAKSPSEVFQIQSEFAKGAFEAMVQESSKMSEAWLKLAGDVVEPLSSRYAVAAEKAKAVAA